MALSLEVVLGRNLTVTTTGGTVTRWDKLSLSLPDDDFEATAASSLYKQYVDGQFPQAVLSVSGFQGAEDATLPTNRDVISAIDVAVGADSLVTDDLNDEARGIWKVKNPKYDWQAGPATFSFEIKSGYLA